MGHIKEPYAFKSDPDIYRPPGRGDGDQCSARDKRNDRDIICWKTKQLSLANTPFLNSFHKGERQGVRKSSCHCRQLCKGKHHDVKEGMFLLTASSGYSYTHPQVNTHVALLIVFHSNMHSLALNYLWLDIWSPSSSPFSCFYDGVPRIRKE